MLAVVERVENKNVLQKVKNHGAIVHTKNVFRRFFTHKVLYPYTYIAMFAIMFIFSILLFFILTPGIVVKLPFKASKYVVAFTHAVIFAAVYHLFCRWFWHAKMIAVKKSEGFSEGADEPTTSEGAWAKIKAWIDVHAKSDVTESELSTLKDNLQQKLRDDVSTDDIVEWIQNRDKLKIDSDKIPMIRKAIDTYKENKA